MTEKRRGMTGEATAGITPHTKIKGMIISGEMTAAGAGGRHRSIDVKVQVEGMLLRRFVLPADTTTTTQTAAGRSITSTMIARIKLSKFSRNNFPVLGRLGHH